ncbi:hypothetical protein BDR07DRAFT_1364291 [Suillus spraguei]|nr:hypothetical protein BDR07DRAFT_1364291 [Suillus spraguei]
MTSPLVASTVSYPIHIHGVTMDFSKSKLNVESAEVWFRNSHSPIEHDAGKTRSFRLTFSPPMKLSQGDAFSLHMRYKKYLRMKQKDIIFDSGDMFRLAKEEQVECIKFHKKIRIVVDLIGNTAIEQGEQSVISDESPELSPTTSEIFRKCPRFRILVIGNTGVGKSSLINLVFGVKKTSVSHNMPGKAEIDEEFTSRENDKFVLHDSQGFEAADKVNLEIVQKFIERRRNMPTQKDQLHAIWLCFEIPRAGGRLLERGTEEFLTLKSNGTLGNIPIVVVFTKYDKLVGRMERTLWETSNGSTDEDIKELAKKNAEDELQDICIRPLKEFAGPDVPYVKISTYKGYEETPTHLIQITEERVGQHSTPEAAMMTSIAQRVHSRLKIKTSIDVGKTRYWKALASATKFKGCRTWDCLRVLHIDIIGVWNFHDPHGYLHSPKFMELIVTMVDQVEAGPIANPIRNINIGLAVVSTITAVVAALAGPAAPIVVSIAVGAVLARWVYDVYQVSHVVLRHFMSYIVHLTLVLQTLYLLSGSQEVTCRVIKLAVNCYTGSPMSTGVHTQIQEYDGQLTILERADSDVLDKIVEVIQSHSIGAAQMSELRKKISPVDLIPDEQW